MSIAVLQLYVIFLCNRCFPIKGHIHVSKRLCKSLQEGLPILHSKVLFCTVFFNNHYDPSLVAQTVKHLSTTRETRVQSLGWEDPLEKEMAIHRSTIAWKIPWTREAWQATDHGVTKSQTRLSDFTFTFHFFKSRPLSSYKVAVFNKFLVVNFLIY